MIPKKAERVPLNPCAMRTTGGKHDTVVLVEPGCVLPIARAGQRGRVMYRVTQQHKTEQHSLPYFGPPARMSQSVLPL